MADRRADVIDTGIAEHEAELAVGKAKMAWWWRIMDANVGVVPLPLLIIGYALIGTFVALHKVPSDLSTAILVLILGGFTCAQIGKYIPVLRKLGAPAILATFVPSYLVYVHAIPGPLKAAVTTFTTQSNYLYLFISSVIVGSILGMDRRTLISGFLKIVVPITCGSIAGLIVGISVGTLLGLGFNYTTYKVVLPVMAGGVGEGALPLSIGYAAVSGEPSGAIFAEILPAVMLGSLAAILLAGGLSWIGRLRPHLTGNGRIQPGEEDFPLTGAAAPRLPSDLSSVGAGMILVASLYAIGVIVQQLTKFPAPVTMLALVVIIKLAWLVSPRIEEGAFKNYQFFAVLGTYPLLFAIGVAMTPWEKLIHAFNTAEIVTILATVMTLTSTGYYVGRLVGLYPIEAGIVAACRASQGGTGDVAILSACDRMVLMPFAQVATRIGGAITVTLAIAAFSIYGR
ncbi:MAG TPA: 2-hydroxycarboxylate transporter family protein [Sphingomicrobium sp.]|nr:2-hydroxycarboxylate transporter family protein [Sphingomicrobium sp.]